MDSLSVGSGDPVSGGVLGDSLRLSLGCTLGEPVEPVGLRELADGLGFPGVALLALGEAPPVRAAVRELLGDAEAEAPAEALAPAPAPAVEVADALPADALAALPVGEADGREERADAALGVEVAPGSSPVGSW